MWFGFPLDGKRKLDNGLKRCFLDLLEGSEQKRSYTARQKYA